MKESDRDELINKNEKVGCSTAPRLPGLRGGAERHAPRTTHARRTRGRSADAGAAPALRLARSAVTQRLHVLLPRSRNPRLNEQKPPSFSSVWRRRVLPAPGVKGLVNGTRGRRQPGAAPGRPTPRAHSCGPRGAVAGSADNENLPVYKILNRNASGVTL